MKKHIWTFVLFMMVFSLGMLVGMETRAKEPVILTGTSVQGEIGSTVGLQLKFENNAGIAALHLGYEYEKLFFSLESIETAVSEFTMTHGVSTIWDASEDYCGNGQFATLNFRIAECALPGEYLVKINVISAANCALEQVEIDSFFVTVTVTAPEDTGNDVERFVTRLYRVCLNRQPDAVGKREWSELLANKQISGTQAASGFVFSNEFRNKNLCNKDYVAQLYLAFMGRIADSTGKDAWVKSLESGAGREAVFNGFAMSPEFGNLCEEYGIEQGTPTKLSSSTVEQQGTCAVCGEEDGITAFVKRLYQICLGREADALGLSGWSTVLREQTGTGKQVAYGFVFSQEFINEDYHYREYVECLYHIFMGREADSVGRNAWVEALYRGASKERVFYGFAESQEFTVICEKYGIIRG